MPSETDEWNAMMRKQNSGGFELDEEHTPHITLVQRFSLATLEQRQSVFIAITKPLVR